MPVTPCSPAQTIGFMKRYDEALPVKLKNRPSDLRPTATASLQPDASSPPGGETVNSLGERVGTLVDTSA
ncbi:MAG: hypothetical protein Q8Q28_09220 [Pseudomonadota bacterium]|nr:hypothetical protein [Pseudomonadota bacterium]